MARVLQGKEAADQGKKITRKKKLVSIKKRPKSKGKEGSGIQG